MPDITPKELASWLAEKRPLQLIDVREDMEWEYCNIGGEHIPLAALPKNVAAIKQDVPVVLVCHHGYRSGQAQRYLESVTGGQNFYNLKGGIHAWAVEVDPGVPTY